MKSQSVLLMMAFIFVAGGSVFAALSGAGTELDPYLIQSNADLDEWKSSLTYIAVGKNTKLMADLDLAGAEYSGYVVSSMFKGNLNGNGHKILNLSIINGHGFFYSISGSVNNLSIINCTVTSENVVVGGFCKNTQLSGTISNCYFSGSVTSTQHYVGGIAGWNDGLISNSAADADVTGGTLYASTGVLVGGNYGRITDCYANGSSKGAGWLGGFVGYLDAGGTIDNCYSTAQIDVVGTSGGQIDGFVGRPAGTIQNCFIDLTTSGTVSTNTGVTGLSSTAMQVESNFTNAGWNFTNIWAMPTSGAPIFGWQADGTYCLTPPFFDYTKDCLVNLADFAAFAASWLDCGYANQALCP